MTKPAGAQSDIALATLKTQGWRATEGDNRQNASLSGPGKNPALGKTGNCNCDGHRNRFYQDIGADLDKRRAEFNRAKAALYKNGVKFGMLYPDKLWVTFQGRKHLTAPVGSDTFVLENRLEKRQW